MFRRRKAPGSVNAAPVKITDHGPDPRGTAYFQTLSAVLHDGIDGDTGQLYAGDHGSGSRAFHGYGPHLQTFGGAAALALSGQARPVLGSTATLDTARTASPLDDVGLRLFAARAARRAGES